MKYPILSVYNTFNTEPIARWSFDEAGNIASERPDVDPASLIDSVCRVVEPLQNGPQQSLLLTGGCVTFPVTPLLDIGKEDFSICAWIRTEDYGIVNIIDKRIENSGPLQGWSFFIYQSKINLQIADEKGWLNCGLDHIEKILPFPVVSDNQWHHVAVAVDRDRVDGGRWYVDGKEVGWRFRPIFQQGLLSNNIPLTVGRRSDGFGGVFRGNIGDIRLYKRVLLA
ncbi:MAG: LamG domain-containing protein, partial [Cyanobacteriota bacterium]|nr:LamG domain-containing protein [Cyanobacteriota bacterium]